MECRHCGAMTENEFCSESCNAQYYNELIQGNRYRKIMAMTIEGVSDNV